MIRWANSNNKEPWRLIYDHPEKSQYMLSQNSSCEEGSDSFS